MRDPTYLRRTRAPLQRPRGFDAGSSPQAWGTPDPKRFHAGCDRFIPTSVGNTNITRVTGASATVHPHKRGEHVIMDTLDDRQAFDAYHGDGTRTVTTVICGLEVNGCKRRYMRPAGGILSSHPILQERGHCMVAPDRRRACPRRTTTRHASCVRCVQVDGSSPYPGP
jgi:hypothetical protein